MTREPIRHNNERAQDPQAPRVSMQRGEKWKVVVKVEYFLILADSAEFALFFEIPVVYQSELVFII